MERRWFTVEEAAEHFRMSPKTFYSISARKRLPPGVTIRIGRAIRFDIAALEAGLSVEGARNQKSGSR